MKFVLFVEGYTENKAIGEFIKRWMDQRLDPKVGIQVVRFEGCRELIKDSPKHAKMYLEKDDVIAVIALLDLYGLALEYPGNIKTAEERYEWAKKELERKVGDAKFRQFFAVHEVEAWRLSAPEIFPADIKKSISDMAGAGPEKVNFNDPPAKRLEAIYLHKKKKKYKKVVNGQQLFKKLDPNIAYSKCPHLKLMLDEMLNLSTAAEKI